MTATARFTVPRNLATVGVVLVLASAVLWSTAGLFTKAAEAGAWTVIFWRGVFSASLILPYVLWRGRREPRYRASGFGRPSLVFAVVGAAATICYLAAFKHTSIANVSILYAVTPLMTGFVAWAWLGEAMPVARLAAALAAFAGVAVMAWGSLGTPNLLGDGLAVLMTVGMSIQMVMFRHYPREPLIFATVVSAAISAAIAAVMAPTLAVSATDLALMAGFGVVLAAANIAIAEGARLLPSSRTALIGASEAPLAPVWAWAVLDELPPAATWVGGAVVLGAVGWTMARERRTD